MDMKSLVAPQSTNNSTLESKESSRRVEIRPRIVNVDACSFRFGSFNVDTAKCRILFGFVGTDGGPKLFPRMSTTTSWKMLCRLLWAVLCSWSGIKTVPYCLDADLFVACLISILGVEAGSDPRGHLGVTWGVYLCAGKPPLADIILSHPPDLTRCDSVIGLAIPAMSGHIQYRGAAS